MSYATKHGDNRNEETVRKIFEAVLPELKYRPHQWLEPTHNTIECLDAHGNRMTFRVYSKLKDADLRNPEEISWSLNVQSAQ